MFHTGIDGILPILFIFLLPTYRMLIFTHKRTSDYLLDHNISSLHLNGLFLDNRLFLGLESLIFRPFFNFDLDKTWVDRALLVFFRGVFNN